MSNVTTLPVAHEQAPAPAESISSNALIFDDRSFDRVMKFAELMASGRATVPKHLQGSVGDCMAVTMQAMRWRMDPFAVGQKTHLVNGALGYEAQLVNAVVQESGAIVGRFHYEYRGEGQSVECRVGAVIKGEKDIICGDWLSAATITTKNSPLWKTNPKQQLGYLQVKNWARAYCPGAILGIYTADELEQIQPKERDMGAAEVIEPDTPPATRTEAVKDRIGLGKGKGSPNLLGQVLKAIGTMTADRESRDTTKALAEKLTDPGEIEEASEAWRKRMEELKAEAAKQQASSNVDPETGEWTPSPEEMAAIHAREIAEGGGK